MSALQRFRDRDVVLANGARGQNVDIPSANPLNYWQAISEPAAMSRVTVDGKLFVPNGARGRAPVVVVALKAGYGVRGATIGTQGDQAALFRDEMTGFFRRALLA